MSNDVHAPGFKWPLLLGAAGFAAGFFGPMLFAPEANQGPLVGILMSGPAGVLLGFGLLGICTVSRASARLQWRILISTAITGALVVLILVQPGPALRGYVMDLEVESCAIPSDTEPRSSTTGRSASPMSLGPQLDRAGSRTSATHCARRPASSSQ